MASAVAPARLLWPLGVQPVAASTSSSSEESGAVAAARPCACSPTASEGRARVVALTTSTDPPAASVTAKAIAGSAGKARTSRSSPPSRPSLMEPTFIITPEGT